MKRSFKKRPSKEKKIQMVKVRDTQTSQRETEAEQTNCIVESHGEESEESVGAGCCFCLRRSCCKSSDITDENSTRRNDDDDDDDDHDNDDKRKEEKEEEEDNANNHYNLPFLQDTKSSSKKGATKNRKSGSSPLSHNLSPTMCSVLPTLESKVLNQSLLHLESFPSPEVSSDFNVSGSCSSDSLQGENSNKITKATLETEETNAGSKSAPIVQVTEDFLDDQKISHKYPPVRSDDTDTGCENPAAETSSLCKSTGSSASSNEERLEEDGSRVSLLWTESKQLKEDPPVLTEQVSATNSLPLISHLQLSASDSCCLTHSRSVPSLNKIPKNSLTRAASLPDMRSQEFTPDISADDLDDETYRFQCSCPGLYQCSVTGLVFNMKGEGDVVYRTVPWNRRLLSQNDKKPAGPLFDIKCQQQSVCQLHLPHCEILSTGGGQFLQVARVNKEGITFLPPHNVTETHVVVNITESSGYGNVKDGDSPSDPVQALVLLFYRPPADSDLTSILSVLLLSRNTVIRDVQRTRKELIGDETYIDIPSKCELQPRQVYTLSTALEDNSIKIQPKETKFDEESFDNYPTSFQVIFKKVVSEINLSLREKNTSICVWESEVCRLPTGVKTVTLKAYDTFTTKRLSDLRRSFIKSISGPVLKTLLDKLQEKTVITDAEREEADAKQTNNDKARFVFDTVKNKGEAASSEMIKFLREEDPFLCNHLGLK